MAVRADWRTGTRSPAWNALWQLILDEIQLDEDETDAISVSKAEADVAQKCTNADAQGESASPESEPSA